MRKTTWLAASTFLTFISSLSWQMNDFSIRTYNGFRRYSYGCIQGNCTRRHEWKPGGPPVRIDTTIHNRALCASTNHIYQDKLRPVNLTVPKYMERAGCSEGWRGRRLQCRPALPVQPESAGAKQTALISLACFAPSLSWQVGARLS